MAEFCKDCAVKILGLPAKSLIMSDESDPDLCEGCGEIKPVVVGLKETWYERIMGHKKK